MLEGIFQKSRLAGGEVIYARDPVSPMKQCIRQVAPDKPRAACYDYIHNSPLDPKTKYVIRRNLADAVVAADAITPVYGVNPTTSTTSQTTVIVTT
jgi:hypothetical protein